MKRRDFLRFLALGAGFSAGLMVPKVFYSIPKVVAPMNLLDLYEADINQLIEDFRRDFNRQIFGDGYEANIWGRHNNITYKPAQYFMKKYPVVFQRIDFTVSNWRQLARKMD